MKRKKKWFFNSNSVKKGGMGKGWLLEGKKIGNEGGDIIRCDIMKYG